MSKFRRGYGAQFDPWYGRLIIKLAPILMLAAAPLFFILGFIFFI